MSCSEPAPEQPAEALCAVRAGMALPSSPPRGGEQPRSPRFFELFTVLQQPTISNLQVAWCWEVLVLITTGATNYKSNTHFVAQKQIIIQYK
jgi:hypothetical protein